VYDPTPEQQEELLLHAAYTRVLLLGGIQTPVARILSRVADGNDGAQ
jgi:hypothetical protein